MIKPTNKDFDSMMERGERAASVMIDNAFTLDQVAGFLGISVESLKQMDKKGRLSFPLTPITMGKRKLYCVYREHWNAALAELANAALVEHRQDQAALKSE